MILDGKRVYLLTINGFTLQVDNDTITWDDSTNWTPSAELWFTGYPSNNASDTLVMLFASNDDRIGLVNSYSFAVDYSLGNYTSSLDASSLSSFCEYVSCHFALCQYDTINT